MSRAFWAALIAGILAAAPGFYYGDPHVDAILITYLAVGAAILGTVDIWRNRRRG